MYKLAIIILPLFLLAGCRTSTTTGEIQKIKYPADLVKIFDKHGGLSNWQKMKSLSYEIVKEAGNEKQMIQLQDRRERIEGNNFVTGYDGKNIWVEADTSYKGNPVFYHQLMFYFYAMPFVLADEGIVYSEIASLEFEGKSYPGIGVGYETGVGWSDKDEYFIHFDPDTHQMAWLGYTVTFRSKKKSDQVKYIRYNDWQPFNGLLLPNSATWYKIENGKPVEARNPRKFTNIKISETAFDDELFVMPEGAEIAD